MAPAATGVTLPRPPGNRLNRGLDGRLGKVFDEATPTKTIAVVGASFQQASEGRERSALALAVHGGIGVVP